MKKVAYEVTMKCHYSICWFHIIKGVCYKGVATENDPDPTLVLNLGIKRSWELYEWSCPAFFVEMSSECKYSGCIDEVYILKSMWYLAGRDFSKGLSLKKLPLLVDILKIKV